MTLAKPYVPIWRVVAAFLVAPLPVAFAFAYWGMGTEPLGMVHRFFSIAILGLMFLAYPCELLIAVPAFVYLRKRLRPTLLNCAGVGLVVAVLPWLVLTLVSTTGSEFAGGHFMVEDGRRTVWGWLNLLSGLGEMAAMGAITGAVFWFVAAAGTRPPKPSVEFSG